MKIKAAHGFQFFLRLSFPSSKTSAYVQHAVASSFGAQAVLYSFCPAICPSDHQLVGLRLGVGPQRRLCVCVCPLSSVGVFAVGKKQHSEGTSFLLV